MKTILIANVSANGKVLLAENPQHQAPPQALGFFVQKTVEAGNLVIGRKTYEVLQHFPGGAKQLFPGVKIVLLSGKGEANDDYGIVKNPKEAINFLTEKGFNEIIIGGGTQTYNAFLENDLVTDVYFNYIPLILGDGGVIGNVDDLNIKLSLQGHKVLDGGIVQTHLVKG
jgi:dihydrofolate reductase